MKTQFLEPACPHCGSHNIRIARVAIEYRYLNKIEKTENDGSIAYNYDVSDEPDGDDVADGYVECSDCGGEWADLEQFVADMENPDSDD